jgi:sphingosine kinase
MSDSRSPRVFRVLARPSVRDKEFEGTLEWHPAESSLLLFKHAGDIANAGAAERKKRLKLGIRCDQLLHARFSTRVAAADLAEDDKELVGDRTSCCCPSGLHELENDKRPAGQTLTAVLRIRYLPRKAKTPSDACELRLITLGLPTPDAERLHAEIFTAAFPRGSLRFMSFVSPVSGSGKSMETWQSIAAPLLAMTPHTFTVVTTTHRYHAEEEAATGNFDAKDVIVACGGDGMAHEVINGLYRRHQRTRPLGHCEGPPSAVLPGPSVALFPTGSGCALAKTLGVIEPLDAAMAMIHASYMPMDLMDVHYSPVTRLAPPKTKGGERVEEPAEVVTQPDRVAFLAVNLAFGATVDIESEVYRWMGNARFTFYAVKKIIGEVPVFPITIRYRPAKLSDVPTALRTARAVSDDQIHLESVDRLRESVKPFSLEANLAATAAAATTASAKTTHADTQEGWITLEQTEFVFIVLCNVPWLARDMLAAPYSHVNDGCMDLVYAAPGLDRVDLVKALLEMEEGKHIAHPKMRYIKCVEVELIPRDGYISVDGERMPLSAIHARMSDKKVRIACRAPLPRNILELIDAPPELKS